ncbi:helix-turn-helix transcriptional regulator [Saccharopolyspora phatthalungensis]|uniref:DNA-binding CsgD family transcriptional regulator n=1 Tax=Saccharopolyspora phatthalungensis TaxID=664693 RepID=A0A840Q8W0_9PSEU|nr:helix-turn-helix transcriptional regulator [Saccharopolyspora phatthalungensis]MBB5158972.1 DNA-binding CsgD family transcriptional regulator [Saccharopolyspora phatthalungensis]
MRPRSREGWESDVRGGPALQTADPTQQRPRWPLAGREAELEQIRAALTSGRGVVLTGERGTGRSALLAAALDRAGDHTALLPSCTLGYLKRLPVTAGNMIGIDDADQLDPDVAAHLHQLVRAERNRVVATVCEDVWAPEGICRLWLDGLAERIEVRPFNHSQIAEVLRARLGAEVDDAAVSGMGMLTAGNAMLLRELTEHAVVEGSLHYTDGVWRWSGLSCADGRLTAVVRMRLGRLTADETELVELVALAGTLCLDAVPGLVDAAESLNRRGVLAVDEASGGVHVRLTVPLCAEVVAAAMPELTARRLRAQLAAAGQLDAGTVTTATSRAPARRPPRANPPLPCASGPHNLTAREREVAEYAAADLTSREIAELLVVSVRTVENHLQRAYGKLGITRRADLAAALAAAGRGGSAGLPRSRNTAS